MSSYSSYRGRSPVKHILKTLLIVVLILLVLAAGAFIYLQKYISFSSDGIHFNPPIPGEEGSSTQAPPSPTEATVIVVSPQPSLSDKADLTSIRAVYLPLDVLSDDAATESSLAELQALGANAYILDMKQTNGTLSYVSELPQAVSAQVNSTGGDAPAAALSALLQSGYHSVARISCFRDNLMARSDLTMALTKAGGTVWYDAGNKAWLNPYNEAARQYLIGIAVELSKMGFNEILLDDLGFPTTGKTSRIDFGDVGDETYMSAVDSFVSEMKEALAAYPVVLSVMADDGLADVRVNYKTGQSLTDLLLRADRLYMSAKEEDISSLQVLVETASVSTKDPAVAFVPVLDAVPAGEVSGWAIR